MPFLSSECFFIHIPRTGGTSLVEIFGKKSKYDLENLSGHYKKNKLLYVLTHCTIKNLVDLGLIKQENLKNFYTFTCVRNIFDKLVSIYFQYGGSDRFSSFDKFINEISIYLEKWKTRDIYEPTLSTAIDNLFIPQKEFICINNEVVVNEIFRFEQYENMINKVSIILNRPAKDMRRLNKTNHKDYRHYYSLENKAKVEQMYKEDIDFFGFVF